MYQMVTYYSVLRGNLFWTTKTDYLWGYVCIHKSLWTELDKPETPVYINGRDR